MPGVNRPYNLVDILGTINGDSQSTPDTTINGVGYFGEADESMTSADSATALANTNLGWDQEVWCGIQWG